MHAIFADGCDLTRQAGIRLVNQPRAAWNFDTILLNRLNDRHGVITHKTENGSMFSSIIAQAYSWARADGLALISQIKRFINIIFSE